MIRSHLAPSRLLALLFGALLALVPSSASAGSNLLANPDFPDVAESPLSPWTKALGDGSIYWTAYDVVDEPGSGSMLIFDDLGFGAPSIFSECVSVAGNAQVSARGHFRKGMVAASSSAVDLRIAFYGGADCGTGYLSEIKSGWKAPSASWTAIELTAQAPAAATRMRLQVIATAGSDSGKLELLADAFSLSHTGEISANLFVDGFESGNTSSWTQVSNGE